MIRWIVNKSFLFSGLFILFFNLAEASPQGRCPQKKCSTYTKPGQKNSCKAKSTRCVTCFQKSYVRSNETYEIAYGYPSLRAGELSDELTRDYMR